MDTLYSFTSTKRREEITMPSRRTFLTSTASVLGMSILGLAEESKWAVTKSHKPKQSIEKIKGENNEAEQEYFEDIENGSFRPRDHFRDRRQFLH